MWPNEARPRAFLDLLTSSDWISYNRSSYKGTDTVVSTYRTPEQTLVVHTRNTDDFCNSQVPPTKSPEKEEQRYIMVQVDRAAHPTPWPLPCSPPPALLLSGQSQKARQANAKIAQQLLERTDENRRVSGQLVQLASSVKVREAIYRSHMEASGGEINPAQQARKSRGGRFSSSCVWLQQA